VCNLASINLSAFVDDNDPSHITYDFTKLYEITKVVTRNLNKVIEINFYPVEEARNSNMRHRCVNKEEPLALSFHQFTTCSRSLDLQTYRHWGARTSGRIHQDALSF